MLETGTVIGLAAHSYRLEAPLAGSAYGLVWRARCLPAGRALAVKFVNRTAMATAAPRQRQRWLDGARQEAAILAMLAPWDGRHVVRLLDQGVQQGLPVLALELLEGDVGAWVARRRAAGAPGEPARALAWIAQLNEALGRLHQHGWRHLDLKPANLLLCDDGARLKLADFGTARADSDVAAHGFSGTPGWQAPEQVFGAAAAASMTSLAGEPGADGYRTSARSDYFAVGALLYYLVTGVALRFCSSCAQALRQDQAGAAARLRSASGALPPTLHDDEARLFATRCGDGLGGARYRRHGAAALLLALLRSLLDADPRRRPPHALAIGRQLAAVRAAGVAGAAQ